ncbi:MAG TPA: hypothetical protein VKU93_03745, partial [Terracidiphilus sp.]|nr:hypothetical protein [Terracidiphilus sp.]
MRPAIFALACFAVSAPFGPVSALCQAASASIASHPSGPAGPDAPVISVDFSNPALSPSHWTLSIHPDGSGHFRSEMGNAAAGSGGEMQV